MAEKQIEMRLTNLSNIQEGKMIDSLISSAKALNAGNAHIHLFNIRHTKNLTASVSVYDNEKPAEMVLNELREWAEANNPEVLARIDALTADMSWNDEYPV